MLPASGVPVTLLATGTQDAGRLTIESGMDCQDTMSFISLLALYLEAQSWQPHGPAKQGLKIKIGNSCKCRETKTKEKDLRERKRGHSLPHQEGRMSEEEGQERWAENMIGRGKLRRNTALARGVQSTVNRSVGRNVKTHERWGDRIHCTLFSGHSISSLNTFLTP
ncbi:hypothetical protein F5148DRAFT_1153480 [Russula earlei]|uniref:Uncharacterized protein n=1 Tax=Russula earlei TaxID=71964 RepID=A0ACC0TTE9_9AGAM|nr:hypothetical protein F5148DRAFT_1153480 [Russula earlei]